MRTCEFVPKVFIAFQENLGFQIDGRRFFSVICKNASHHTEEPFWNIRSMFTRFVYFAHAARCKRFAVNTRTAFYQTK